VLHGIAWHGIAWHGVELDYNTLSKCFIPLSHVDKFNIFVKEEANLFEGQGFHVF
jgi:hypothetical protein